MRRRKHNPKISIAVGVILFIVISIVVINAQDMKTISRVKVSNQDIVISQGETGINNANIGLDNVGSLSGQGTNFNNQGELSGVDGSFSNAGSFSNQNTGFGNNGEFNNTGGSIGNVGEFGNTNTEFGSQNSEFGNQNFNYENANGEIGNFNVGFNNKDYRSESNRYKYQNIDWGTWKSNFVNRILDDSMYIHSLDLYGFGTWLYYSFTVTNEGAIKDVYVFSFYLSEDDKKKMRSLIRDYAYQPITIFPKDSKRTKAKVKAVMLLGGSTESKSNASNFRDIEKIKIQY